MEQLFKPTSNQNQGGVNQNDGLPVRVELSNCKHVQIVMAENTRVLKVNGLD